MSDARLVIHLREMFALLETRFDPLDATLDVAGDGFGRDQRGVTGLYDHVALRLKRIADVLT